MTKFSIMIVMSVLEKENILKSESLNFLRSTGGKSLTWFPPAIVKQTFLAENIKMKIKKSVIPKTAIIEKNYATFNRDIQRHTQEMTFTRTGI